MAAVHPLKPEALRRTCDPKFLSFATTEDFPPLNNVIGQQLAVKAIAFGLNLNRNPDRDAGRPDADGGYPAGTLYHWVQENLAALRRAAGAST